MDAKLLKMDLDEQSRRAAHFLIGVYRDTVEESAASSVFGSSRRSDRGVLYRSGQRAQLIMIKAAEAILQKIGDYPLKEAVERLWPIVLNAKDGGITLHALPTHFTAKVTELVDELSTLSEWECVYAISAMDLGQASIAVGRCTFHVFSQEDSLLWGKRFQCGMYSPPSDVDVGPWNNYGWGQLRSDRLVGGVVGVTRVKAADHDHALTAGAKIVEESLQLVTFEQATTIGFTHPFPFAETPSPAANTFGFCIALNKRASSITQSIGAAVGLRAIAS